MIFPIVRLLTHAACISLFETCFLSTSVFTYSNASISHILQYQRPTLQLCGAHPIKLIVAWPRSGDQGKTEKRIERSSRTFNWFSEPNL